jgi:hypothetical protein
MADQIVITEKSSQAKDVRAAVGSRYGDILPAEGHLFDLLEPEDLVPAWKRWSPILLRPEGLYRTRPAEGGNKAAKLRAIREDLRTADNSRCGMRPRSESSNVRLPRQSSVPRKVLRPAWRASRGQAARATQAA